MLHVASASHAKRPNGHPADGEVLGQSESESLKRNQFSSARRSLIDASQSQFPAGSPPSFSRLARVFPGLGPSLVERICSAALFQLPPEVQERGEIFYFLPEEVAGRCLRQVLAWFEGTLAAPLAITEAMVADGMDAANKHRNADAEERVRAILAAALAAGQVEPRSTVIADLYRAAAAIQTRIDQAHAVEADGSPIVLELVACRDRILETAPSSAADVALQVRTLRVMLKEDRNRPERIEEALAQIADRLEALGAKARA
jgi:hypothetical protein